MADRFFLSCLCKISHFLRIFVRMKPLHGYLPFVLTCILVACRQEVAHNNEFVLGAYRISLEQLGDSMNMLFLDVDGMRCDSISLPYPIYRFDCGDLTGDGVPEVCVGVVKPTRYWSEGKRLFIYHLYRGRYIRPLWLGSRVGRPLLDFHICRDSMPARIHTEECGPDSTRIRNEYSYQGFGLRFRRQLTGTDKQINR